ncbi:hypothetical protein Purlil1_1825 [Purpureocillium lilacinum]|uniref:Uncharacterized protein n=1 Tax=Purpureocillium lilacinum TaxID=33203 RepID=A0ABR0CAU3_PURLI|nr:hypothetical protein Purlil1_1825 [Purpureocillium lilacinum]
MCDAALGGDDDADDLLGTGGSGGSWLGGRSWEQLQSQSSAGQIFAKGEWNRLNQASSGRTKECAKQGKRLADVGQEGKAMRDEDGDGRMMEEARRVGGGQPAPGGEERLRVMDVALTHHWPGLWQSIRRRASSVEVSCLHGSVSAAQRWAGSQASNLEAGARAPQSRQSGATLAAGGDGVVPVGRSRRRAVGPLNWIGFWASRVACWQAGSSTTDGDGIHGLDGTWKDGLASGAAAAARASRQSIGGRSLGQAPAGRSTAEQSCAAALHVNPFHGGRLPRRPQKDTWGTVRLAGQGQQLGASHVLGRRAVSTAGGPNGTHGSPQALAPEHPFSCRGEGDWGKGAPGGIDGLTRPGAGHDGIGLHAGPCWALPGDAGARVLPWGLMPGIALRLTPAAGCRPRAGQTTLTCRQRGMGRSTLLGVPAALLFRVLPHKVPGAFRLQQRAGARHSGNQVRCVRCRGQLELAVVSIRMRIRLTSSPLHATSHPQRRRPAVTRPVAAVDVHIWTPSPRTCTCAAEPFRLEPRFRDGRCCECIAVHELAAHHITRARRRRHRGSDGILRRAGPRNRSVSVGLARSGIGGSRRLADVEDGTVYMAARFADGHNLVSIRAATATPPATSQPPDLQAPLAQPSAKLRPLTQVRMKSLRYPAASHSGGVLLCTVFIRTPGIPSGGITTLLEVVTHPELRNAPLPQQRRRSKCCLVVHYRRHLIEPACDRRRIARRGGAQVPRIDPRRARALPPAATAPPNPNNYYATDYMGMGWHAVAGGDLPFWCLSTLTLGGQGNALHQASGSSIVTLSGGGGAFRYLKTVGEKFPSPEFY